MTNCYDDILQSAMADNTRKAYQNGWQYFAKYCRQRGEEAFPATPELVIDFLIEHATQPVSAAGKYLAMGTVALFRSAITHKHLDAGLPAPTRDPKVETVFRGLMRIRGGAVRQVRALREGHIRAMLRACGTTPIGLRDAAIIAIGFAGALRRSEICNLRVEDVEIVELASRGGSQRAGKILLNIRKSKTDQQGRGQKIAIPKGRRIKPIARLQAWLDFSGLDTGYVFQSMRRGGHVRGNPLHHSDIARILKGYATRIGLDASEIAGHSLRAGFITSAAAHRASLDKIMEITRHRNPATVMTYIRNADVFVNHAGEAFL